jgi:integrase
MARNRGTKTGNPVRMEGKPGAEPMRGAQPFNGEEIKRMRPHAGEDLLAFLLLRHSGFRGSDAVQLTWSEVRFDSREIERLTQERRKLVVLPVHTQLLFALEAEYARRNPLRTAVAVAVVRHVQIQKDALVWLHAHPHRFRDTFAVDLLCAGAGIYDVARMLGHTAETIEKHYAPFVPALRERVRRIMEAGSALEAVDTPLHTKPRQVQ